MWLNWQNYECSPETLDYLGNYDSQWETKKRVEISWNEFHWSFIRSHLRIMVKATEIAELKETEFQQILFRL